jgi:hypothetical protein
MVKGAIISPCGTYRYALGRELTTRLNPSTVMWVMLNPSTADAKEDDPTIRVCRGFSSMWGYDRFVVANLFAFRATDPGMLLHWYMHGRDIQGPRNTRWITRLANDADKVVIAWGRNASDYPGRADRVMEQLRGLGKTLYAIGFNADGTPMHPLMKSFKLPLVEVK